jgi:sialate O-acetylesterase
MVRLDALQPADPATLTIAGSNTITLNDVLVGEVWIGSGQSNMDTDIGDYVKDDAPLAEAARQTYPQVRQYRSDGATGWTISSPGAPRFSAQLFYFAITLQKELGVPVGVMEGAVRGSSSSSWISDETSKADPGIQKQIADFNTDHPIDRDMKRYDADYAKWKQTVATLPPNTAKDKMPSAPWKPRAAGGGSTGDFYVKHIVPMIPYGIRGVLWDQGEGGTIFGCTQEVVMHALIAEWRKEWGQGDFPWIYVQKPSGGGCALDPANPINKGAEPFVALPAEPAQSWREGLARQEYTLMMKNPNTFMVTSLDLATGVHPKNKSGYATRDVRVALATVYGKPIEYIGPVYQSCKVEGNQLRLSFIHVGGGLTFPPGQKLQGFAIAGADKHFHWADATIDGQTIMLTSPQVSIPVAARYAWAWNVAWADLFNKDGFPAITFRTDEWN